MVVLFWWLVYMAYQFFACSKVSLWREKWTEWKISISTICNAAVQMISIEYFGNAYQITRSLSLYLPWCDRLATFLTFYNALFCTENEYSAPLLKLWQGCFWVIFVKSLFRYYFESKFRSVVLHLFHFNWNDCTGTTWSSLMLR